MILFSQFLVNLEQLFQKCLKKNSTDFDFLYDLYMKNKTKHPKINRASGVIIFKIELLGSSLNFISLISKNFLIQYPLLLL